MEAILPFNTQGRENFWDNAVKIGFDEFVALKFMYTMQDSDLDVFQLMGAERLSLLNYGWEVCEQYLQRSQTSTVVLPESIQTVIKRLIQHSLNIWFSKEWGYCGLPLRAALLYCLRRARKVFTKMSVISLLDWDYLLKLDMRPWHVPYFSRFFVDVKSENTTSTQCIDKVEEPASADDVAHLKKEGLFVSLLRLIKLFDTGSMEVVKKFSIRIIAAWNYTNNENKGRIAVNEQHKCCLLLICHIYLMAIYELDNVRGFVIDNMMHNIRFYCQNIHTESMSCATSSNGNGIRPEYTSAQYLAMTCKKLGLNSSEFFETIIFDSFDDNFTTLFGVISHAYMSYVLGNQLMEMNNLNEEDFTANLEYYKRILNFYILERERSESFMLEEINKLGKQSTSHNEPGTVRNMTDYKSKICKGNRRSNLSNCEEDDRANLRVDGKDSDRNSDPVFQYIPNATILNYAYNILAKRSFKGWQFAKLTLLLKIIGHDLNEIETWRYHPGLTTEFMLNLETKLSRHFEDLAIIFRDHPFMEQEFWLTAFYLDPKPKYFAAVARCGMRIIRQRNNSQVNDENVNPERNEKMEKSVQNFPNTKFGLLSSTFDVHEIVRMANHDAPNADYEPLRKALHSFRLPDSVIKDLLTVTFLPRNKSFAWAVNWSELRKRCKDLLKNNARKRRLVELNMAEANDRLKYLKIDYEKYKHRPQLDYGSIEQGYENVANYGDYGADVDYDDDDDDEDDYEDDFNEYPSDSTANTKEEPVKEDIPDIYYMGIRRTRARTAAIIASVAISKEERARQREEVINRSENPDIQQVEASKVEMSDPSPAIVDTPETTVPKCNLKDWLQDHTSYKNSTNGFKPFPDIWNFDAQELQTVKESSSVFVETELLLQKFTQLQNTKVEDLNHNAAMETTQENTTDDCDDDESDTSTTAFMGSHERIACSDEMVESGAEHATNHDLSVECKEVVKQQPPKRIIGPLSYRHAANQLAQQTSEQTGLQDALDTKEFVSPLKADRTSIDFEDTEAKCSEDEELKKECIKNQLKVLVRRLTVADLSRLRQPKVCLRRIYPLACSTEPSPKRRCGPRKAYIDSDASNKSSSSSTHSEYINCTVDVGVGEGGGEGAEEVEGDAQSSTRILLASNQRLSSDSSTGSDELKLKRPRGRPRIHPKKLVATPRSASGLKMRIYSVRKNMLHAESEQKTVETDFIQITTSSTIDETTAATDNRHLSLMPEDCAEMEMDPLFEEEIIVPFD